MTCNSPLSISNHTHHSLSCSEYTTFAFLHDVIPSIFIPSPSKSVPSPPESHAVIRGTTLVSFSCPSLFLFSPSFSDALKQAKIQSILADLGGVQEWLRHLPPTDRSAGEAGLASYRQRFARRGAIAQSYQPVEIPAGFDSAPRQHDRFARLLHLRLQGAETDSDGAHPGGVFAPPLVSPPGVRPIIAGIFLVRVGGDHKKKRPAPHGHVAPGVENRGIPSV